MKRICVLIIMASPLLAVGAVLTPAAQASPNAAYELVRSSYSQGGTGSAGIYAVSASIGQAEAGQVSAGIYTVGGGLWGGGAIVPATQNFDLFLPLVAK